MTLDEKMADPRRPKVAPVEYTGQWVAWNKDETNIIAHGTDVAKVRAAAIAAGHADALLEIVHRPDRVQLDAPFILRGIAIAAYGKRRDSVAA